MPREISISAPAKVNLHLQILEKRADGYHGILSLFQAVSLFDEIRIKKTAGPPQRLRLEGDFALLPSRNSIVQAVESFGEESGIREGLEIALEKRIPLGGGLGGGSSDAAAVLLGLQALFGDPVSRERLAVLGAGLGSDVPFFLQGAAAVVEGRGETVHPLAPRGGFALAAVFPRMSVDTSLAYGWLDEMRGLAGPVSGGRGLSPGDLVLMYEGAPADWGMWNDFDAVVLPRVPGMREGRMALERAGAWGPRLTGSGSTLIGVLPDEVSARKAVRKIADMKAAVLLPLVKMPGVR